MAVQNDFSKGSILSHMARIALPMTLAQCRLPKLLTQKGVTTIERVDDAG